MSGHPLDGPVPAPPPGEGRRTFSRVLFETARRENMTLRDLYNLTAAARGHWVICGTPQHIADMLEEWFVEGAADGFNILPPYFPGAFADFVDLVVPELQRRGLFRRDYEGTTLRDHFGLARVPTPPPAAAPPAQDESHRRWTAECRCWRGFGWRSSATAWPPRSAGGFLPISAPTSPCIDPDRVDAARRNISTTAKASWPTSRPRRDALAAAELIVCEGRPRRAARAACATRRLAPASTRRRRCVYDLALWPDRPQSRRPGDRPDLVLRLRHRPAADRTGRRSRRAADPAGRRAIRLYRRAGRGLRRHARRTRRRSPP